MTTEDMCVAIIQAVCEKCNKDGDAGSGIPVVSFGPDWGEPNTLTITVGEHHTHVAGRDFNSLVEALYRTLVLESPKMSWSIPIREDIPIGEDK